MNDFIPNGCSPFMSKAWRVVFGHAPPWENCCFEHDFAYWAGGTHAQRLEADQHLRDCVIENGHPYWAAFMYRTVRMFGWIYWGGCFK